MGDTATLPPDAELKPARDMAEALPTRWPGESEAYRRARTELLAEEIELRRQIQRVAQHRRALPPGPVAKDYRFLDAEGKEIGLVDLFGRHDTLFTYFWMFGPERERPCPMCTSFVGSLDVPAPDIEQRVGDRDRRPLAGRAAARFRSRARLGASEFLPDGRRRFREGSRSAVDGDEWPGVFVWQRDGDAVRLFWAAEGGEETADPGFDPHLAPDPTPLWNILDWTPEGRGADWYPKLDY